MFKIVQVLFVSFLLSTILYSCATRDFDSDAKEFLINYYKTLENKEVHKFDDFYEPILSNWFDQNNVKIDDVKSKSRDYFKKWPVSKHIIDFNSLNCTLNENGTLKVNYNLDYFCSKKDAKDSLEFNIDIELLLSENMKIISIQDDIVTRTKKEYFSEDWNKIKNSKNASYYRIVTLDKDGTPLGLVKDYYITGELQWTGGIAELSSIHDSLNVLADTVCFYYKNGRKSSQSFYDNGVLNGDQLEWNEDGILYSKATYTQGELNLINYYSYYENSELKNIKCLDFMSSVKHSNYRGDEIGNFEKHIGEYFTSDFSLMKWSSSDWNIAREMMFHVANSNVNNYVSIPYSGGDFSYSVYMKNSTETNNTFGIVYGYYDNDNFNNFLINGNEYLYYSIEKGVKKRYSSWTTSSKIEKVWNQLMIQRVDDKLSFYINGFFVSELEAFNLRANNFGFTVTNPSETTLVAFDEFEFIEPISKLKIDEL